MLQLVDLYGDVVGTVPIDDDAPHPSWQELRYSSYDEFGAPQPLRGAASANAPPARYGWLGAAQRSADTPAGVVLMGVRLYHPGVGRFLQVDPVAGGSANQCDYCNADPVNCTDLGGTIAWGKVLGAVAVIGSVASFIPGPIGAAAGAISAVAYGLSGNPRMAAMMTAVAAAQLVGAGPAVRVGAAMMARSAGVARAGGQAAARTAARMGRAASSGTVRAVTASRTAALAARARVADAATKNNVIRIGRVTAGTPVRVSIGAQLRHWKNLPKWRRVLQPVHIHMERARAGLTWNPTGRSWKMWGNWR